MQHETIAKDTVVAENELVYSRVLNFVYALFFRNLKILKRQGTKRHQTQLKPMFHAIHVMIVILESPRDPGEVATDGHINMFLSCCHQYSQTYYDIKKSFF